MQYELFVSIKTRELLAASSLLLLKGFQIVLSFKGHNVLFPNTWFN